MLFSQEYNIKFKHNETCFNPILDHDTRVFIDPFLIFKSSIPLFKRAHEKIIVFFNEAFKLAAKSRGNTKHLAYRKLLNILIFPEVSELCLGYTERSTSGLGTAKIFAREIADIILKSIALGITHIEHFEELGLLGKGIGCDRISDITANILKAELILYTKNICMKYKVKTTKFRMNNAHFDFDFLRWESKNVTLPLNPYTGEAILLVPAKYLRDLPTINSEDFFDYCWTNENEVMRSDFNYEVKSRVKRDEIIELAKKCRFLVQEYINALENGRRETLPYDLENDPKGLYQWDYISSQYVKDHPVTIRAPHNEKEFVPTIEVIIKEFEKFVVDNGGYKLLWNEKRTKPRSETSAQLLFLGISRNYCRANNVDVSREVNLGRGPVDFKFSSGYRNRCLIELKLASNPKLMSGFEKQLVQYLKSEDIKIGMYLIIAHRDDDYKKINRLREIVGRVRIKTKCFLKIYSIDARSEKPSASKL